MKIISLGSDRTGSSYLNDSTIVTAVVLLKIGAVMLTHYVNRSCWVLAKTEHKSKTSISGIMMQCYRLILGIDPN